MDEGTSKAIPLRRSRSTRAATAPATARRFGSFAAVTAGLTGSVRRAVEPGRQMWLAGLGSTALTVRAARELWSLLVSEGAATEHWLRQSVGRTSGNDTSATG
jgi:predicted nucleic acid-binding Zn ribbon protein